MNAEVALSLGSNLGDRREQLAAALRGLEGGLLTGLRVSSLYETAPVEVGEPQPRYLNLCALGECALRPERLLAGCQALERAAGRPAGGPRRPRVLDIDLLYYDDLRCARPGLCLPHPGLARRRFVLAPLAELKPHWRHPDSGRRVDEMLAALGESQPVTRLAPPAGCAEGWWRLDDQEPADGCTAERG
ncbi:2-amino-4-hydroxy-6-hydroxymethyldihydropteridine diphosphokinase [bacterium]|nr:2-amino-4-hydroxy-6-hydroxymethyldihydropteridine diphosphokinase [bacterium]